MAGKRHDSTVLSWGRLHVDLPRNDEGTWQAHESFMQTAWLLLLSTYDRSSQPSCYCHRTGSLESLDVLSLSIDRKLALEDHRRFIQRSPVDPSEQHGTLSTMIWQGAYFEPDEWIARNRTKLVHGSPEIILVSEVIDVTELAASDLGSQASCYVLYDQSHSRFGEEDVVGRVETLKTILSFLVGSPGLTIDDTDFLSDYDKRRIIAWNEPIPDPPVELSIVSAFAAKVEECPDAPAIYAWDGEMTYLELDTASSKVAASLSAAGRSGPHDMVLFNMKKSKWALVAALGILKSGKAIVPTDPSWPQARLDQILGITEACLVVCDKDTKGSFGANRVEELMMPLTVGQQATAGWRDTCSPKDLAFVLFSSGSTGVPKGMLRQHGTACTGSFAHAKAMHLDRTSRVLQFANHVFDVAMLDFFTTLVMGACVCIPSDQDRKNDLAGFVQRSKANWALLTPTVAELLDPSTVPSFKFVTLGGESINGATLRKWLQVCRVGINYGSAEVDVTHARDVQNDSDVSNVGQRLPSCTAFIVDPDNPAIILPVGAMGELVISGPTMAREYLNAPEKTAQVFMKPPENWYTQGVIPKENPPWMSRIYLMGDLFRQKCDGSLEFVSRKDFQVKVNGQKLELGEVESKLVQHPMVKQCAVLYPSQGPYVRRLVAIVQSVDTPSQLSRHSRAANATKSTLTLQSITQFLQCMLPPFMLPTVLIHLKSMPYTPTMKIDRNRLKSWLLADDVCCASLGEVSHISTALSGAPLSDTEKEATELSRLVADVVAPRQSMTWKSISGHDNRLSDIGIDSAQMMRLSSMIHKRFGVKLLVDLLGSEDMTTRKLAALLASGNTAHADRKALTTTEAKTQLLRSRVAGVSESVLGINPSRRPHARHVFLTGATGYLGTRILVHLLRSSNISSVTVLVRSSGAEQALDRVKHAVLAAGADGEQCSNLRAWPGDLSQPRLGLSPEHWIELSGSEGQLCGGKRIIDTIIHCGAVVDWTKSYNELAPHNVGSTEQLLRLTLATPAVQRFIFISGGRYPDPVSDDRHDLDAVYAATAEGNAYAQTKFVSEQLVDKVRHAAHNKSIKTVSPAYLIGSRNDGLANQDDYIWRIIWASLRVGSYNADENDQWLFVAEAGCVAERIVALALQDRTHPQDTTLRILDGLSMQRMWENVCAVLKKPLTPVSAETWLQKVKQDMDETPNHLLWPLADTLEGSYGYLTQRRCAATDMGSAPSTGIDLAVRRNIEYLDRVGFFS